MKMYYAIKEYCMKKLLYIFICVFVLAVTLCLSASAANTTYTDEDGVVWNASIDEANSKATITGATISKRTNKMDIPDTIKYNDVDYPVTAIANNAFKDKTLAFGKLSFPETLESIGEYAFYKTNIYSDIVIPDSVKTIGRYAFAECKGILSVKLPSTMIKIPDYLFSNCFSLTSIYSERIIEEVGSNAFNCCYALHSIKIGEGTKSIGSKAFYNGRGLDGTLDLSTVTSCASDAFQGCFNITGVKLSAYKFELSTFTGCSKIASYEVAAESSHYTTIDGVLYNKSVTVLYRYPIERAGEIFTVPETVVEIYSDAFSGAYHLGRINLSKGLTKIGANAFKATGVDYMYIPDSVTSIGGSVLSDCPYVEWVVISKQLSSASSLVANCPNIKLVIGRHPNFSTSSVGNSAVCKKASEYTCTSHIYGFLDDTASCTESGVNTCIICDRSSYVKPTGHEGAIIETSTLDCTTDYYIIVDCVKCGDHRAKTIYEKATGHVSTPKKVGPDNKPLKLTVETCSVCNETIISNYTASFYTLGDINNDGSINYTDTDLLANYIGGKTFDVNELSCDINNDGIINVYDLILLRRFVAKIDSEITAKSEGCKKHLHLDTFEASKVTCIDDGIIMIYCLDCGAIVQTDVTEKSGHTWNIISKINATCSNTGYSSVTCTICKTSTVLTEEMLPHTQNWWTMPGKKGYEYSECAVCGSFENRIVDYTEFDTLIKQLPKHYETYYNSASLSLIKPILESYKLALTQEEVDRNVEEFKNVMPRIQYAITDVPVIYINSLNGIGMNYSAAQIAVAYYDDNGEYTFYYEDNGEAKIRGNSTANPAKKPYNIKFSTNVDLFGLGKDNKYCLLANAFESTLMRNALVRKFNELCGLDYACKWEFVDVYLDGAYQGNYLVSTPVDPEETRVDIDKKTDAILEIEAAHNTENIFYFNRSGSITTPFFNIKFLVADGNELSGEGYSKVFSTIYQVEYAIVSGDINEIKKYADVDSLVRFYILADYFKDQDFLYDSTRFYIEDGKLHGGPAWDYDRAAGHVQFSTYRANYNNFPDFTNGVYGDSTTGEWANASFQGYPGENWTNTLSKNDWVSTSNGSNQDNYTWLTYIYQLSPEFRETVSQYVFDIKDEMTLMYADIVDELGAVTQNELDKIYKDEDIYASIARDVLKWGVPMKGDELPMKFNSYKEAVDHLRSWLKGRHQWMLNHYSAELLATYCASLADKEMLDPYTNAYAKDTTTSLTVDEEGNYIYTVNINIKSDDLIGYLEEMTYNQVHEIFTENLSYAYVVVNLCKDNEIVSTYSYVENILALQETVNAELAKASNNANAARTTTEYSLEDGMVKVKVKITNGDTSIIETNQAAIFNLVKKYFNNAGFYVSVDVEYYSNTTLSSRYTNNFKR